MACPRCGSDVPAGARFCPACGAPTAPSPLHEERKFVSVLFVDLVGSTARADGADPEDVREENQLYYRETSDRIERHGGVVEKYVGDAVLAVFGAPLARSDDAERAVRASLSILEGIQEINRRNPDLELQVRVAVCTGEAMVTMDAAPGDALATGDVVNTAARLQSSAPAGRVVVGAETRRLTRHAFGYEALPAVDAKGKREPVEAWLVGAPLVGPAERPTSATQLVGRDRELLLIRTMWERAAGARSSHLVSVIGPAGIGKSRLAEEVSAEVTAGGGLSLWGRSLPYEEQTPYRAFGQILRTAAGIYENDAVDAGREKLESFVVSLLPPEESADATRYLSLLLGLGIDERTSETIHLQFAARRVVELLSDRQPLLLIFEDVHWADDSLLDLVDYLVTHVVDQPVVFLALARPEFLESRPTWGAGMVGRTTLPLEPLTRAEATQVAASLLAGAEDTLERIVDTAEGNPLFIEELVAALADDAARTELPGTVRAAIASRIDALPQDARTALLRASVIGQSFWRGVLARLGTLADADAALEALEARGLVRRRPQSQVHGDVEFAFKHVLIRDVAYATLPKALRRELHASTARVLEESVSDPGELAWILAHHWREGGDRSRAMEYLIAAGDRASTALAVEETYDFYTRALDLAETDGERRSIRLRRGLALVEIEDFPRADRELAELIPELDGRDEVVALLGRARSTFWTEQTTETLALAERALERVRAIGATDLEAPALARLGATFGMRGEDGDLDRAFELGERALHQWSPGSSQLALAEHYHMHADTCYWTGRYPRALEMSGAAAVEGGLEPHSAESLLRGSGLTGLILAGMGRYEEAIEACDGAIAIARRLGRPANVVTNYSTAPLRDIFWLDEARTRSERVADGLGPSEFNMPWMNARTDLISADLLLHRLGEVENAWASAWDDANGSPAWERWLLGGRLAAIRAEAELLAGRFDDAATWAERSVVLARSVKRRKYEVVGLTLLGRALTADRRAEAALPHLREAVTLADALGSPLFRWQARAALGDAESKSSESGEGAETHVREAASIIEEVARSLQPERAARYLDAPQVREVLDARV
jgi:class 3 adenylate cyclase/tetratricopeptide (TPR) repeat protein